MATTADDGDGVEHPWVEFQFAGVELEGRVVDTTLVADVHRGPRRLLTVAVPDRGSYRVPAADTTPVPG